MRRLHPLGYLLLAAGLLTAAWSLVRRHRVEQRNRAVQLVLDLNQVRQLATSTGHPLEEALHDFRGAGARGLAVSEELLQELVSSGRVRVARSLTGPGGVQTAVATDDPALFERVRRAFEEQLPQTGRVGFDAGTGVEFLGPGARSFHVPGARWEDLLSVPAGMDPVEVQAAQAAGLEPVARLYNFIGATPDSIRRRLAELPRDGVRTVVFAGEDVLGFQGQLPATALALGDLGLNYGAVEFGKQRGDEALSRRLQDRLIRVHSIASGEISRLTDEEAIDRYARAVDERNIRICYLRLPASVSEDPYLDSLDYVRRLAGEVERSGFELTVAHPLERVWPNGATERAVLGLTGAGAGAAGLLLLATLFPIRRGMQGGLAACFGIAGAATAGWGGHLGREGLALGVAVAFPTLAFLWLPQPVAAFQDDRPRRRPAARALGQFGLMCAISLVGALLVAGLLSERSYMLKVDSFVGIKLAHLAPLILVGLFYLLGLTNRFPWPQLRSDIVRRSREALAEPVRFWHAIAMLVGLAALALLVLRTGNEPGVGVSALEMKFRSVLEQFLVRPRTKEFLLGHPLLLLGLAMAGTLRWRRWALPLLLVGTIGQASIVNSFCHIHTPLTLSALRTLNGIWLGALTGLGLIAAAVLADRLAGGRGRPQRGAAADDAVPPERLRPEPERQPSPVTSPR